MTAKDGLANELASISKDMRPPLSRFTVATAGRKAGPAQLIRLNSVSALDEARDARSGSIAWTLLIT